MASQLIRKRPALAEKEGRDVTVAPRCVQIVLMWRLCPFCFYVCIQQTMIFISIRPQSITSCLFIVLLLNRNQFTLRLFLTSLDVEARPGYFNGQ